MKRFLLAALLLTTTALADDPPPPAEDPLPLIQEAQTAWQAGEIAHSRRALEQAVRSVTAKNAAALLAFLPPPFDGWTVNDGEAANASMLVFGGGLTLDRTYVNDSGDVRVEILADSDLVSQMAQMYSDAQMIASMGMKTETIGGETAIVDPDGSKYTFLIDQRTLITVSGSATPDIRKSYSENINFAGLKALK
jgi:hypothetical protein